MLKIFAVCQPGLESILQEELQGLKLIEPSIPVRSRAGGIEFIGNFQSIVLANLKFRTASRILVRVGEFSATGFPQLKRKIARLDWSPFLHESVPIQINISSKKSRLYHKGAIAQRVGEVLEDQYNIQTAEGSKESEKSQSIFIHVLRDRVTVSIDSTGTHLHKRGYRLAGAKAPVRETLAAAMLLSCGWDQCTPIIDPFCGSGTIPIEAAMMASGIPPGIHRRFSFQHWPGYQEYEFRKLRSDFLDYKNLHSVPEIIGYDRDTGAIEIAEQNAVRARTDSCTNFRTQSLSELRPLEKEGWIVTNPPYGHRITDKSDLRNLYSRFGQILKDFFKGWQFAILCSDARLIQQLGISFQSSPYLDNGGIKVRIYTGRIS